MMKVFDEEKNGIYAMLYRLQFPEFLEEENDITYADSL